MGRWGGGRKEHRPIVTKHPPPHAPALRGRKKTGLRGGEEAMVAFCTRTLAPTEETSGGWKEEKSGGKVASFVPQLHFKRCAGNVHAGGAECSVQLFCRERVKPDPRSNRACMRACTCARTCIHYVCICASHCPGARR